jgi:hypothetical protein
MKKAVLEERNLAEAVESLHWNANRNTLSLEL